MVLWLLQEPPPLIVRNAVPTAPIATQYGTEDIAIAAQQ
jgi:hypothetical protein